MADAVIRSGGEKEPEQHQRTEKTSAGVLGVESNRAGAAEDTTQNGGRSESGSTGEALLVAAAAAEDKVPTNLSISSSSQRRSSISTANEQQQQPPSGVLGAPSPLSKPPEDQQPVRRNFQIPRKSREKKALFQPVFPGSREFDDILKILHSSYLDPSSVSNFKYKRASLVHSELLEKEFTEKRRQLKCEGRPEKELLESYAFLMVDRCQIQSICEKGLQVGHSKITILGRPSMGVYISKYADLLQPNPLEPGATGDVIIFKIIKGKMKSIYDYSGVKGAESTVKSVLDPTPKHECHVSKTANKINSLLAYRAYELTQYYFYEYDFDEIKLRPRHVCPHAVVSFTYKDDVVQGPKFVPPSRANTFHTDRSTEKSNINITLWRGQLWNKGKLVCHLSLKATARAFLPCKLPEKLEVEKVVSIDELKKKISPSLFLKETYHRGIAVRNGVYGNLYEVVEKSRSGSHLEGLLQKLEKEKLVLVKPLVDRGFLFLLSPWQMMSPYDHQTGRSRVLHALFLFPEPRVGINSTQNSVPYGTQKNSTTMALHKKKEIIPELTTLIQSLHFALIRSRKDSGADFNAVVEKYMHEYFRKLYSGPGRGREFKLYEYVTRLDDKTFLYSAPRFKGHIDSCLQNYIFDREAYQLPVSRAKELLDRNRKPHRFSPISDYEATEDYSDFAKAKCRKRIHPRYEAAAAKQKLPPGEYDTERLKELISLIQCRKKNVGGDSDSEDPRIRSGLKRKLEKESENLQKYLKMSDSSENICQYEGSRTLDSPHSVFSMNSDHGGHEGDFRQADVSDPGADREGLIKALLETLATASHWDPALLQTVSQALGTEEIVEDMGQNEYESIPAQDRDDHELPNTAQADSVTFKDPQSPAMLEVDMPCLPYPADVELQLPPNEAALERTLHLQDASTGSTFEDYSLCPSASIEHGYGTQHSSSNNAGEVGMHWKLIPITGLKSPEEPLEYFPPTDALPNDPRVVNRQRSFDYQLPCSPCSDTQKGTAEDGHYTGQVEKLEDQYELTDDPLTAKHSISAVIETALLEEYKLFARKIQEILQQKNVAYISGMSTPVLSTHERIMKLSEHFCLQASEISVQEYIQSLSEKLNNVILASSCMKQTPPVYSSPEALEVVSSIAPRPVPDTLAVCRDSDMAPFPEPLCNTLGQELHSHEQPSASLPLGKEKMGHGSAKPEDQTSSGADLLEPPEKTQKSPDNLNVSTPPAFSDFISRLKPEVFNSLVEIMKDVQKNTVKFYIHEEEESVLCREIKEYLRKLGNTECHPEQFLKRRADLDKLLIIIQNEDIANLIHKIPGLVTLKRLSCVSFAGVDSLDDVKNHTYNELFVSGGFVVSDESVLNPESITTDKLKQFLTFLEDLNNPDGKWQWKVHCKIQKKLKELGRMNANALNLLTLLNAYQKKHLVEILSYHNCDSQTRNAPELDCLIRLQAQNIQQRHVVFLTEKNLKTLSSYADNGIVVAAVDDFMHNFKSLVGYHNSVTEQNHLSPCSAGQRQSVLVEKDEKDEEDMSLDSGDELSEIEICSDASKYDTHVEALQTEAKGPHGVDAKESCLSVTELSPEAQTGLVEKTYKTDLEEKQPITPVSTTCCAEGEKYNAIEQTPFSNFQVYSRQLNMSHQFSHFNVLTHQTFLGTTYPISPANQSQDGCNYFLSAYSQSMDTEKSSPGGWDSCCDSSRPYSEHK
ncbi:PREDICTED: protein TASOR isoform X1 [Sturnus vulgaris]|uniref:protein TASOR isoform X1 n=2 Tax=Sturnus vulgaris TaxID=9172 RepID=UPI00071A7C06|nr:PREDICTED: protein TASOR isoform X1 [Sturnus vulgaris]